MALFFKGQPKTPGSGRRRGTPNKLQRRVSDEMANFILRTMPKLDVWMDKMDKYSYDDSMQAFTKILAIALPRVSLPDMVDDDGDVSQNNLQDDNNVENPIVS